MKETFGVPPDCEVGYKKFTALKLTPSAKDRPTIHYRADDNERAWVEKWRPSIFMPRWASRITLEVTDVRVERLQDISEADAIAEGIEQAACEVPNTRLWKNYQPGNGWTSRVALPQNSYHSLWDSIHGAGSWDANPWVFCVSFKRVDTSTQREAA